MGDDTSNLSPVIRIGPGGGAPLRDITLGKKGLESRSEGVIKRCLRTRGDERVWKPATGTELEKKKSYHPELSALADTLGDDRRDVIVLREDPGKGDHKMELIHLNRTCTCVDLASSTKAAVTAPHPAAGTATTTRPATRPATRPRSSDDNLPGEEKVHRVRHEAIQGEELISALRDYPAPRHLGADTDPDPVQDPDQDPEDEEDSDATPDNRSCLEEGGADLDDEQTDSYRFFSNPSNLSPDSDVDYLAVRPSLASTQLNEIK